jgi:hypothetical protein
MSTFTLALIIGVSIGAVLTVWQTIRMKTGENNKVMRNADGTVYAFTFTIVGSFILWSSVSFVVALIPIAIIKAIF